MRRVGKKWQVLIALIIIVVVAILFETFQQQYYMLTYKLPNNSDFFVVFYKQALSWLFWFLSVIILIRYAKVNPIIRSKMPYILLKYLALIFGLVIINVLIIAFIRLVVINQVSFNLDTYFSQYVRFFMFQKTPIYTLGYIAVVIVMQFYYRNEDLVYEILSLSQVKNENELLYKKLKEKSADDRESYLSIKIGDSRKIIPMADISWLEADGYCIKVHTSQNTAYTMRSSLTSINEKLEKHFLRVHRSAIVNMQMIEKMSLHKFSDVTLKDGTKVPVSKTYVKVVKQYFQSK